MENEMEVRHLGRELKTAVEIAIVMLAPTELVERLALLAGLLDALGEFPANSPQAAALASKTLERARRAIEEWRKWEQTNGRRVSA